MQTKLGFSLIELTVTIAIASILAAVGISGYMQSLMISRRKEATIGLQRAMLMLSNSTTTPPSPTCPYDTPTTPPTTPAITDSDSNKDCLTATGLYYLNYNVDGFADKTIPNSVVNNLISTKDTNGNEIPVEKVIFRAKPVTNKSQIKDTDCPEIYLTDMNNLYPVNCVK